MTTRRERLERKIEKRLEWAEKREKKAMQEYNRSKSHIDGIPFGQPILVGHHSEGKHRAALKRSDSAMQRAHESSQMAKHHKGKAGGLQDHLDRSIFSDDHDAVERLEERIAGLEKAHEAMKTVNKICRNKKTSVEEKTALIRETLPKITDESIHNLLNPEYSFQGVGFPTYSLQNNNANIRRLKQRLEEVKKRQELANKAQESMGGVAVTGDEYIEVTFAEKPERCILNDLKAAGFYWRGGSWNGKRENLPEIVKRMAEAEDGFDVFLPANEQEG